MTVVAPVSVAALPGRTGFLDLHGSTCLATSRVSGRYRHDCCYTSFDRGERHAFHAFANAFRLDNLGGDGGSAAAHRAGRARVVHVRVIATAVEIREISLPREIQEAMVIACLSKYMMGSS